MKTLLAALTVLAATPGAVAAADLSIQLHGVAPKDGPVMIAIHSDRTSFEDRTASGAAMVMLPAEVTGVVLRGLAPGNYAVKAYQDSNGDKKLSIGSEGRPSEPVAISGSQTRGWPDFAAAAVPVNEDAAVITLGFALP